MLLVLTGNASLPELVRGTRYRSSIGYSWERFGSPRRGEVQERNHTIRIDKNKTSVFALLDPRLSAQSYRLGTKRGCFRRNGDKDFESAYEGRKVLRTLLNW